MGFYLERPCCGVEVGNAHHFSQRTRGIMEEINEDMHPPAPVGDSMIPFPRSQILTGGLTSLWWWHRAAQVLKVAHIFLLQEVMPVMRGKLGLHPVSGH